MNTQTMSYEVFDKDGRLMLSSSVQYDRKIEIDMINEGYVIKLNGKRVK